MDNYKLNQGLETM